MLRRIMFGALLLLSLSATLNADNGKSHIVVYLNMRSGSELYIGEASDFELRDGKLFIHVNHNDMTIETSELQGWRYATVEDVITSTPAVKDYASEQVVEYTGSGIHIIPDTEGDICIYSASGEMVKRVPYSPVIEISYSDLPSGINLITISGKEGSSTLKIYVR